MLNILLDNHSQFVIRNQIQSLEDLLAGVLLRCSDVDLE